MGAVVIGLGGCGTGGSGSVSTSAPTGVNAGDSDIPAPSASTSSSDSPTPTIAKFGQSFTYDDGLAVTVGPPAPYTPSDSAAVSGAPQYVQFKVSIVNGTSGTYEPSTFSVTLQSGTTEEQQVFDSANGIGGSPSTVLLPGRQADFTIAFGAHNPNDLVMQVAPDFNHNKAIFTS